MATGRSNYLTKQAGEYLVAAELSRRGFIATTFTGNVFLLRHYRRGRFRRLCGRPSKGNRWKVMAVQRERLCRHRMEGRQKKSVANEKNHIPIWCAFSCKLNAWTPVRVIAFLFCLGAIFAD